MSELVKHGPFRGHKVGKGVVEMSMLIDSKGKPFIAFKPVKKNGDMYKRNKLSEYSVLYDIHKQFKELMGSGQRCPEIKAFNIKDDLLYMVVRTRKRTNTYEAMKLIGFGNEIEGDPE